VMQMDLDLYQF